MIGPFLTYSERTLLSMKKKVQALVGLALGILIVWLLFRDTDWGVVWETIREVHVGWFLLAQIPIWASFPIRVQRWTYIVRATEWVSFRHLFSATQIGFLANFTLPARLGEVIRALVLTRLTKIPFSKTFAMVALDRVTDLFGLMAVMLIGLIAFQPTGGVVIPAETFAMMDEDFEFSAELYRAGAVGAILITLSIVAAFVILYANRHLLLRISDAMVGTVSRRLAERVHIALDHFADGFEVFRSPLDMAKSISLSIATWGCAVIMLMGMYIAFGIDCPWYTAFVMQAMLAIAIALPGAPGLVGQYHLPIVVGLVMLVPGIDLDRARAFAIVAHLINLPPLIITGVYALMTERLGLLELGRQGAKLSGEPADDSE